MTAEERKALRSFVLDKSWYYGTAEYHDVMRLLEEYDTLLNFHDPEQEEEEYG